MPWARRPVPPLYLLWETELLLVSCNLQKRSVRPHIPTTLGARMRKCSKIPNVFGEHGGLHRAIYVQILNSDCQRGVKEAFYHTREVKLSEVDVLSCLLWSCD